MFLPNNCLKYSNWYRHVILRLLTLVINSLCQLVGVFYKKKLINVITKSTVCFIKIILEIIFYI